MLALHPADPEKHAYFSAVLCQWGGRTAFVGPSSPTSHLTEELRGRPTNSQLKDKSHLSWRGTYM